jgi:hypothetical protein
MPAAEQSRIILEAARQHFTHHPLDLIRGLLKGQVLGPLKTFNWIARLAFMGAAGDSLRIFSPAVGSVIPIVFAGFLWCQLRSRRRVASVNSDARWFFIWFLIGYVVSIPFIYEDGGLRVHAPIFPFVAYMLVWLLLPPSAASERDLSGPNANRLLAGSLALGVILLGLLGWISVAHPMIHDRIPLVAGSGENTTLLWFEPGWPHCDLRKFERSAGDDRPRRFSGVYPDGEYGSGEIRQIAGRGGLYLGYDAGARDWKAIHTDQAVGVLNKVEVESEHHSADTDPRSREFYEADSVQIISTK